MSSVVANDDRISALQDGIIHEILSFMPMDAAVRTGILSTRWRDLWKYNPVVCFPSLPTSTLYTRARILERTPVTIHDLYMDYGFIHRCLDLYKAATLREFIVIGVVSMMSQPNLHDWIDFALTRQVQSLEIYLGTEILPFVELPGSFYCNRSLKCLALTRVKINPLRGDGRIWGFASSLKKLSFFRSRITDQVLESIMSTRLLLESLTLHRCSGLVNVKVHGLALKEFTYIRSPVPNYPPSTLGTQEVSLAKTNAEVSLEIDAPNLVALTTFDVLLIIRLMKSCSCNLVEARLFTFLYVRKDDDVAHVRSLFNQLAQLKVLATSGWLGRFLGQEFYLKGDRCTIFKNVKEFYFCGFMEDADMVFLLAFLGDCALLEKIKLDFRNTCWHTIHKKLPLIDRKLECVHFLGSSVNLSGYRAGEAEIHVGLLNHVKSIDLLYYTVYESELELVKRLLQRAVSLETVTLIFEDPEQYIGEGRAGLIPIPYHQWEPLREQVSLLPRASPSANILIG